jgi:hypothetical protein
MSLWVAKLPTLRWTNTSPGARPKIWLACVKPICVAGLRMVSELPCDWPWPLQKEQEQCGGLTNPVLTS